MVRPRLFIDMDGVLADFDGGYAAAFNEPPPYTVHDTEAKLGIKSLESLREEKWAKVRDHPKFFRNLKPMHDAHVLFNACRQYSPIILTGVPYSVPTAAEEKREWIKEHCGAHVVVITCASREKYLHGKPGDILIDDREKCGLPWIRMGGEWIVHRNAGESVVQVRRLMGKS